MTLVGVSFDRPEKNAAFRAGQDMPFELWTDDNRTLAMHCGAARSKTSRLARRVTVVLDAEARPILRYGGVANVVTHADRVLDDCRGRFE